jgi:glycosyltransferase involved in cell wall biosynthesis
LLGLHAIGADLQAVPLDWHQALVELSLTELTVLRSLARRWSPRGEHGVHVQHCIPWHFRRLDEAMFQVGRTITMCETDRLPGGWCEACSQMDEIWVPSAFNAEVFARSGVPAEKLVVIPEAISAQFSQDGAVPIRVQGQQGFTFLSIFDWSLRKGWDVLLRAFAEEFEPGEDVTLMLRVWSSAGLSTRQIQAQALDYVRRRVGAKATQANIILINTAIPVEQLPNLYVAADAFVLPSRGEGWGRTLMEAMATGLPTIGTRWSGNLEFMNDENSFLIDCNLTEVSEEATRELPHFRGHRWAEPSVDHLRQLMRTVFQQRQLAQERGASARVDIRRRFDRERIGRMILGRVEHLERRRATATVRPTSALTVTSRAATLPAIVWEGDQMLNHSLAHVNREICRRLVDRGYPLTLLAEAPRL